MHIVLGAEGSRSGLTDSPKYVQLESLGDARSPARGTERDASGGAFHEPNLWRVPLPELQQRPSLWWALLPGGVGIVGFLVACVGLPLRALSAGTGLGLLACSAIMYSLALGVGSRPATLRAQVTARYAGRRSQFMKLTIKYASSIKPGNTTTAPVKRG